VDTKWYLCYESFDEDNFDNVIDEHCEDASGCKEALKQFVLFSSTAGRFVAAKLFYANQLQINDTEHMVASFSDDELADLKYDEIFFMYYYISCYPVVYYEHDGRAARLEDLATLPENWLRDFLYDLAERLYVMKRHERRDEYEIQVTNSFLIFEPEAVPNDGIEECLVALDFHVYGVSDDTRWFLPQIMFYDMRGEVTMKDHCGFYIRWMEQDLEDLVLFSTAAGRFVEFSLDRVTNSPSRAIEFANTIDDDEIAHLAYDEILTMSYYADSFPFMYYDENYGAACINCERNGVPHDWLGDFLYEIARRLFPIKKDQYEVNVTRSFLIPGTWPDSDA
jgi:hypothetical protein